MDKLKTHIDDVIDDLQPAEQVAIKMGWSVLARLWNEAEKNEVYEKCAVFKYHFTKCKKDRAFYSSCMIVAHDKIIGAQMEVDDVFMLDYVARAKKFLKMNY